MTLARWSDTGSGPAIVLLHAFPCDHHMWDAQVPALVDEGWRVLVPDLPGFGASALPIGEPHLGSVVDILVADLLERGVDRLVVAGLSVGGYLVMEWLRRRPEMLAGIALCDTKATVDAEQARAGRFSMAEAVERDPAGTGALLEERMLAGLVGETTHAERPEVIERVRRWLEAASAPSVAWYQRAMADRPDSLPTLGECEVPALVLWGEQDTMSGEREQQAMLGSLRDAKAAPISRAGHLSAVENPVPVAEELVDFVAAIRRDTNEG